MGKVRGTIASYKQVNDSPVFDIEEACEHLAENVGNVPEYIGWGKACEIHLIAKGYLQLLKELTKAK